jgi:tripartite-type tricarboxylate transporter receptor subunit TctC
LVAVAVATGLMTGQSVSWAAYPEKPITFVCFSSPGGATDQTARSLQPIFQDILKNPVVVNNMPPLEVGVNHVYRSKKDGYTLLFSSEAVATWRTLGLSKLSYHDFDPIMAFSTANMTITVNAKTPYKTVQEFIDAATTNPGKITFATPGTSTSNYIAAKMLEGAKNFKLRHLPFKGAGPSAIATISGEVDANFNNISDVIEYHRSGDLRILAVLANERSKYLPDIQALGEIYPELAEKMKIIPAPFYILSAPKGIDPQVKKVLVDAAKEAVKDPRWLKQIEVMTSAPLHHTGEELDSYLNNWEAAAGWTLYDEGIAKNSPEKFGIPKIK